MVDIETIDLHLEDLQDQISTAFSLTSPSASLGVDYAGLPWENPEPFELNLSSFAIKGMLAGIKTVDICLAEPKFHSLDIGSCVTIGDTTFEVTGIRYYRTTTEMTALQHCLSTEDLSKILPGIASYSAAERYYLQQWSLEDINRLGLFAFTLRHC